MSYQRDRDHFIATMTAEGMPLDVVRRILRHAQTVQRCAELACSSEAADRDCVPCPDATGPYRNGKTLDTREGTCLCRDYGTATYYTKGPGQGQCGFEHGEVPRITVTRARAERMIREWCDKATIPCHANGADPDHEHPCDHDQRFEPVFSGDPRGACVKIRVPSGRSDSWGGDGMCIPTRS